MKAERIKTPKVSIVVDEVLVRQAIRILGLAALGMPEAWQKHRQEAARLEQELMQVIADDALPVIVVYVND